MIAPTYIYLHSDTSPDLAQGCKVENTKAVCVSMYNRQKEIGLTKGDSHESERTQNIYACSYSPQLRSDQERGLVDQPYAAARPKNAHQCERGRDAPGLK